MDAPEQAAVLALCAAGAPITDRQLANRMTRRGAGQVGAARAQVVAGRLARQGLVMKDALDGGLVLYEITSQGRALAEAAMPCLAAASAARVVGFASRDPHRHRDFRQAGHRT